MKFAVILILASHVATAGSGNSSLGVTVTVSSSCTLTAGALAFGSYDSVSGAQVDVQGSLTVACSKGAATAITLSQGVNAALGSTDLVPLRRMKGTTSTNLLSYALFQDPARLVPWGNTALTGTTYLPASSAATSIPVYGRITGLQDVVAGAYTDTVSRRSRSEQCADGTP